MATDEYLLTPKLYKRFVKHFENENKKQDKPLSYRNRGKVEWKCSRCGFPFQIGDVIVSKTIRGGRKRYYHKTCWEKMFIDVPDSEIEVMTPVLISNN